MPCVFVVMDGLLFLIVLFSQQYPFYFTKMFQRFGKSGK